MATDEPTNTTSSTKVNLIKEIANSANTTTTTFSNQQYDDLSVTDPYHNSDLFVRTGYSDAKIGFQQLQKGKADGDRKILWIRAEFQDHFLDFGRFIDSHAGKVLFVSLLTIATFCVGLKSATFHSTFEELWMTDVKQFESIIKYASYPKKLIDTLSTHQLVIQRPKSKSTDILSTQSLLNHLAIIQKATQVTVNLFDVTWKLRDICQAPSVPVFEQYFVEQAMEKMMPCTIITPLDCFWDGAKLLGPDYPVKIPSINHAINWTSLNPQELIENLKNTTPDYNYQIVEDYLHQSGISSGYQEKPCLNPFESHCPKSSTNKNSRQLPDVGAELTGGCYGFSAKYMHWPAELLVGDIKRNKTGHIKDASALQTVVQLMNSNELYEFTSDTWKVKHLGSSWNTDKSALVLKTWQKTFAQEIKRLSRNEENFEYVTFSTTNLNGLLENSVKIDYFKLGISLIVIVVYSWYAHSGLAVCGVLLIISSTTAGLGLCSLLGYSMNILTLNVLPFICVGLALRDVYLLLHTLSRCHKTEITMKRCGLQIIISSVIAIVIFLIASFVPVMGLKVFTLECAIVTLFNAGAILIVLPALITLNFRYEEITSNCLATPATITTTTTANNASRGVANGDRTQPFSLIPNNNHYNNNNNKNNKNFYRNHNLNTMDNLNTKQEDYRKNLIKSKRKNVDNNKSKRSYFEDFIKKILIATIIQTFTKSVICIVYLVLIITLIMNVTKIEFDMDLSSFIPEKSQEFKYIEMQQKYFGFYNFYVATNELEYPFTQQLLYDFHNSFTKVHNIVKDSNGGLQLNNFWLSTFRDYLAGLQKDFDENYHKNNLNSEKWSKNASERSVLAFKLLSQTGVVEYPVDKSQILEKKLVENGIINPKAFYNYFTVWSSNDQMGCTSSQANFHPKPSEHYSSKEERDLKIPKSLPLSYAQMPFYLKNLKSSSKILSTLNEIYTICDQFNDRGLHNYPMGLIFTFYDQFRHLFYLIIVQILLMVVIVASLTSFLIKWSKVWCILISILISTLILVPLQINSLTVILLAFHWIIVGRNLSLILIGFICSIGNKERRITLSLELNSETIIKGDVALFLSTVFWITSDFNFIQKQLFNAVIVIVSTSLVNSLIFFPILLSIFGPNAEIIPYKYENRISTPTPEATPIVTRQQPKHHKRNVAPKATREPSLTTITEESCNQSIIVQPEVTVEYTNNSNNLNNANIVQNTTQNTTSNKSEPESNTMTTTTTNSCGGNGKQQFTTKVIATTNIKVEILHQS